MISYYITAQILKYSRPEIVGIQIDRHEPICDINDIKAIEEHISGIHNEVCVVLSWQRFESPQH